jgi:hypothetical protein
VDALSHPPKVLGHAQNLPSSGFRLSRAPLERIPVQNTLAGAARAGLAIGVAILGRTSSPKAAIVALVGFTAPSLILLVMAPAMILAIVNLSPQTGG